MLDSVRVRLTLWHVGLLAFLLIAFSVAAYALLSSILYGRVDAVLASVVDGTVSMLAKESNEAGGVVFGPRDALRALSFPETSLGIFRPDGRLVASKIAGSHGSVSRPALAALDLDKPHIYTTRAGPAGPQGFSRAAALKVEVGPTKKEYVIVASQSLEPILRQLETLRRVFYTALPAVLLLAGFGGFFLARQSLAPVVAMSEQARRIGAENLEERLSPPNPRDELGRLAAAFNELLARLNAAFSQQRQFMADASHQLRTPVSVIQTATSVALDSEHRAESEYRSVLTTIDRQVRRLARIVEDLFQLARADSGRFVLQHRHFYLDELFAELGSAAKVLAAPKGIRIQLPEMTELPCEGDEELLRQMISNLLDNSIKHTAAGGSIGLALERRASEYVITVSDSGSGIPPEAQPHIFKRFFRADTAASVDHGASGAGLGLPIARWIAEAHHGRLELQRSDERGSAFVAVLPQHQSGKRNGPQGST
jgi:two-component system OmpR family sensor kinase